MSVATRPEKAHPSPREAFAKRVLVPVVATLESEEAVAIACKLAAKHGTEVTALAVIEIPVQLPLSAQMFEDEAKAKGALATAAAIGELYGVTVKRRLVRARAAGEAIVEEASAFDADLVVLHTSRRRGRRRYLGKTADVVLKHAPCRVMVGASPA